MKLKTNKGILKRVLSCAAALAMTLSLIPANAGMTASASNTAVNLAAGKSAYASTENGGNGANYVTDSNSSTRWESEYSNYQWVYVDLGSSQIFDCVEIEWEGAYGKAYYLQVSDDGLDWTTVSNITSGDGGTDTLKFDAAIGRYVRVYGLERASLWGFSIYELKVYAPDNYAIGATASYSSIGNNAIANLNDGDVATEWYTGEEANAWFSVDLGGQKNISGVGIEWTKAKAQCFTVEISNDNANWTTVYTSTGGAAGPYYLFPSVKSARYVKVNMTELTSEKADYGVAEFSVYGSSTSDVVYNELSKATIVNAWASSDDGANPASNVRDGDLATRWISATKNVEDIVVELNSTVKVGAVKIDWEAAYANNYEVLVSTDNSNWTSVYKTTAGSDAAQLIRFGDISAKYVKVVCNSARKEAYSIYEITVYEAKDVNRGEERDAKIENLQPHGVTASTEDGGNRAVNVADTDPESYWRPTTGGEACWITLDLGGNKNLKGAEFIWEKDFDAKAYKIFVSTDNENWSEVYSTDSAAGTEQIINFSANARYVKAEITATNGKDGYKLITFEAKGYTGAKEDTNTNVIVGQQLKTTNVTPSSAKVLTNDSGMSGLGAPNHLAAGFSSGSQGDLVRENMYHQTSKDAIVFDYGQVEALGKMFVWNYNDTDHLDYGMRDILVEYSVDGNGWARLGQFELAKNIAFENESYGGNMASNLADSNKPIDFGGVPGRYVRITPISSWSKDDNYGLSEVRIFRDKTRPKNDEAIPLESWANDLNNTSAINATNNTGIYNIAATDANDERVTNNANDMYLSGKGAKDSSLIINLDGTYAVDTLKIWNYNNADNLGSGIKEFKLYYTTSYAYSINRKTQDEINSGARDTIDFNGGSWVQYGGTWVLPQGTGNDNMSASLVIDLQDIHAQTIRIEPVSNYNGTDTGFGLSEVRAYCGSGWAVEPSRTWSGLLSSSGSFKYQGNESSTPFASSNQGVGWLGGDGIQTLSLNGGQLSGDINASSKTMFTFQDSWYGNMGNYRQFDMTYGYAYSSGFSLGIKNMAFVMLTGNEPDPRNTQFYLTLNNGLSDNKYLNNILDARYWISDETIIDGVVYMIAAKIAGEMDLDCNDFYAFNLNANKLVNMSEEPTKLIDNLEANRTNGFNYATVYEEGDYIYMYTRNNDSKMIVARCTRQDYKSLSNITFWNGSSWVSGQNNAVAISDYGPGNEFNITYMRSGPYAGYYVNVSTAGSIWGETQIGVSESLTGPFRLPNESRLYTSPERYEVHFAYKDSPYIYEQWNYNAKAQPVLSPEGELLITYHFGIHDDRGTPALGYFGEVTKEFEHPTFINMFDIVG